MEKRCHLTMYMAVRRIKRVDLMRWENQMGEFSVVYRSCYSKTRVIVEKYVQIFSTSILM